MRNTRKLELAEARAMVSAAAAKAQQLNALESICVVDAGGFPLLIERMDGARVTGAQIAWNKAFTAATHRRSTHLFNRSPDGPALPGNEAFGIQLSFDGRFAVFAGGMPIVADEDVIGGIGLSGGNAEQDIGCGVAALEALRDLVKGSCRILVDVDIRR